MNETLIPNSISCVGFIMDGNRRFAKEKGRPTLEGHREGADTLLACIEWVEEKHIPHAVFYAFSTENWNRSEAEVSYLMDLFRELIDRIGREVEGRNIRIRFVGQREDFSPELRSGMEALEEKTASATAVTIWIALSYGGRAEIVAAVNEAVKKGKSVTEELFANLLWTAEMPDPDIIMRSGGDKRLSNFMTWGSVYSELYFVDTYWPALKAADFDAMLVEYEKRERRRGQ